MKWLAKLFIGEALGPITDLAKAWINKEITEEEFRVRLNTVIVQAFTNLWATQAQVIMAEINSESWLVRHWRPIVALTSFFSVWYVIVAIPHLVYWGVMERSPSFGDVGLGWLNTLAITCVGGYIGGRSVEKVAAILKGK